MQESNRGKPHLTLIPHRQLTAKTLHAVVQEFVTRDGTDHSSVEDRVLEVIKQLEEGSVELHFDVESGTCNILTLPGKSSL